MPESRRHAKQHGLGGIDWWRDGSNHRLGHWRSVDTAGKDALIGAAAGVVAGGLIGNSMDREQEARLKAQAPQTYVKVDQGQPLSIEDVKALAKAGISEDVIINQIKNSRTSLPFERGGHH